MKKNVVRQILKIEHVHEWFDSCYLVSTLIAAYATPLDSASYVNTEATNMESVYVPEDTNTTQSMKRVASNMEHVLGRVTGAKRRRCSNCEGFGHTILGCKLTEMTDADRVSLRELKKRKELAIPVLIAHKLHYAMSEVRPEPTVDSTLRAAVLIHRARMQKANPYLQEQI
jgi:hypothetical protein